MTPSMKHLIGLLAGLAAIAAVIGLTFLLVGLDSSDPTRKYRLSEGLAGGGRAAPARPDSGTSTETRIDPLLNIAGHSPRARACLDEYIAEHGTVTEDDFDPLSRLIRRCVTRDAKLEADARQGLLEQLDYWTERD